MIDIKKEMVQLEEKYKDFFDGINKQSAKDSPRLSSSISEFYDQVELKGSSYAYLKDEAKQKLSEPIIKEMQAIIDTYNRG